MIDKSVKPGSLEGDLEFLFRVAQKVNSIREDLGKVGPVLEEQVEEAMLGKRNRLDTDKSEQDAKTVSGNVYTFFQNRVSHLLAEDGFSKDVIAAVVSVSIDNIPDVWRRVEALETLKNKPDFEPLAVAFKRVVNIIKKAELDKTGAVDEGLFQDKSESALYTAYNDVKQKVAALLKKGDFTKALHEIATLRSPVDTFFDDVLVMTDDVQIQNNRLALLGEIASLFKDIADFSKIST